MPVNDPFTASGTKRSLKRSAALGTDGLRNGSRVLSVCAYAIHNAGAFCLFCLAKYQNTGIPASMTSVITIVPTREW